LARDGTVGDVVLIEFIKYCQECDKDGISAKGVLMHAATCGRTLVVKELPQFWSPMVCVGLITSDDFELFKKVFEYSVTDNAQSKEVIELTRCAAKYGRLKYLRYLIIERGVSVHDDAANEAALNGHLACLKCIRILLKNPDILHPDIAKLILFHNQVGERDVGGHLECLEYVIMTMGVSFPPIVLAVGAQPFKLPILKWLVKHGCSTDGAVIASCRSRGTLAAFNYLVTEAGCEIPKEAAAEAAQYGNIDCLNRVHVKYNQPMDVEVMIGALRCIESDIDDTIGVECLQYAVEHGGKLTEKRVTDYIWQSTTRKTSDAVMRVDVMKWAFMCIESGIDYKTDIEYIEYALDHAGQFTDDIVDHIGQFGTVKSIDAICKLPGDIYKNILLRVAESAQRYDQHNLALLCKVKAKGWVTAGRIKDSLVL
jgi:hypothetical protein